VRRLAASVTLAAVLLGACSGGDDGEDGSELGVTQPPTSATVPDALPESTEGTGVVSLNGVSSSFAVDACQLETTTDPSGLETLVLVTGRGTTAGGVPFDVEVRRFASGTDEVTTTDAVSYADAARIYRAQRYEVNGALDDLLAPDARSSMIRTREGGVAAQGIAGPPGAEPGDDGIIGIAVDATCG